MDREEIKDMLITLVGLLSIAAAWYFFVILPLALASVAIN